MPVSGILLRAPGPGAAGRTDADFVDLTLPRLEPSGQQREVAEATRWVADGDRELLSPW